MNRSVLQSSPVQQMMAGNPNNLWNFNTMHSPSQQPSPNFFSNSSNNFLTPHHAPPSSFPFPPWHDNQELPESWSQLLMSGLMSEEDKAGMCQMLISQASNTSLVDVKQESSANSYVFGHGNEEFQAANPTWSQLGSGSSSSSKSSGTSFSSSVLDFSNNKTDARPLASDPSSECNSTGAGGAFKKARVQPSTTQSTFKVRKEKLGDRITALHQLVSPFGKTDTASVLLEAIGYIRFLQSQIEALSLPYLGSGSGNMRHQQSVQGDQRNCIFPEDPGQLLNENCLKRKAAGDQDSQEEQKKDLRSRGLCLVPVSCTLQVGSDNGADYWAPAFGGGFR
ncbi:transcription factor bHLH68-like isoform X2 [Lotus japonicus]|uniref:transcription factor bHLH68-like isoform X2 n=1 Tax=Lotus japonicus TaxID=34305 RepID=UPI00258AF915|nr:transcription factor bHLH68-like isoform X2 [Lotus japonicus]